MVATYQPLWIHTYPVKVFLLREGKYWRLLITFHWILTNFSGLLLETLVLNLSSHILQIFKSTHDPINGVRSLRLHFFRTAVLTLCFIPQGILVSKEKNLLKNRRFNHYNVVICASAYNESPEPVCLCALLTLTPLETTRNVSNPSAPCFDTNLSSSHKSYSMRN